MSLDLKEKAIKAGMTRQVKFLARWRAALNACSKPTASDAYEQEFWEGKQACENLLREELLEFVMLYKNPKKRSWKRNRLVTMLSTEIKSYRQWRGRVAQINFELAEAVDFFTRIEKRFSKERSQFEYLAKTRNMLTKYAHEFRKQRIKAEQAKRWFWRSRAGLEAILREPGYDWGPDREMDLDAGFQRRIARSFRLFMPKETGISLRTISRLVVLVYLSAGLVEVQDDKLIVKHTNRELLVQDVEAKLRRSGLDRTR